MDTETVIAGTELKLTARYENNTILVKWDKMSTTFCFHEGFAALLRPGQDEAEGMVELVRVALSPEGESLGYVEPLLFLAPT